MRVEIVEAAIRLLTAVNDELPVSLRAVAREVGVAPQSVYLHFRTKPELLYAVVERLFGDLQRTVDEACEAQTDPKAALRAACVAYCDYALRNPAHYKLLMESRLTREMGSGFQGSPGAGVFGKFGAAVQACLPVAARSDRESFLAAAALWSGLHGIVSLRLSKSGFPWPPLEQMIDGVLARGSTHRRSTIGSDSARADRSPH